MFSVGTKIVALRNFGTVQEGQPGIVTGLTQMRFFIWKRPAYLCTFFGNVRIAAQTKEIDAFNHPYNLIDLEKNNADWAPVDLIKAQTGLKEAH